MNSCNKISEINRLPYPNERMDDCNFFVKKLAYIREWMTQNDPPKEASTNKKN